MCRQLVSTVLLCYKYENERTNSLTKMRIPTLEINNQTALTNKTGYNVMSNHLELGSSSEPGLGPGSLGSASSSPSSSKVPPPLLVLLGLSMAPFGRWL